MKENVFKIYKKEFSEIRTGILTSAERKIISGGKELVEELPPWEVIYNVSEYVDIDLYYIKKSNSLSKSYNFSGEIIGASEDLYINNSVKIATGVIFDTSEGPIFIDKNVKISPFSYLKGPLFVGENTSIKDARIYGGVIIGKNCKIAGELENVIIGDFTNKSHESALIHSYVGDWCNIAGYTKNSRFKCRLFNYKSKII